MISFAFAKVQEVADATPWWANWLIMAGSVAVSWLAPVASLVAILWGSLQIFLAVEKRWFHKKGK